MSYYVTRTGAASRWRHARGFSAIELIMVMAVVGVLLAIALPNFKTFMQNSRLTTQANTLVYALNLARSSAVQLDRAVEVCASADGATCNGAWNQGWIVGYPALANCGAGAALTTVLGSSPQLGNNNQANEKVNGAVTVCYQSNGQTNNGIGGTIYQFSFCDNRGAAFGQDVEINFTGRIQSGQTQGKLVDGVTALAC